MMRVSGLIGILIAVLLATSFVAGCKKKEDAEPVATATIVDTTPTSATVATATILLNDPDKQFVIDAYAAILAAEAFAHTADAGASNVAVKAWAHLIFMDLGTLRKELKEIADRKGVTLPDAVDATIVTRNEALAAMSGRNFDTTFLTAMVDTLTAVAVLLDAESKIVVDADLRAWVDKTIPKIAGYIAKAKDLQAVVARSK